MTPFNFINSSSLVCLIKKNREREKDFSSITCAVLCSVFQGLYEHAVKPEEAVKDPDHGSYCTSNNQVLTRSAKPGKLSN